MGKAWNKTTAFGHFGIVLENVQWSWSGISEDGGTVAVVLWQDGVKGRDGALIYRDDEDLEALWRQRTGNKRRIIHLQHALDALDCKFRAVIAKAVDINADPRQIEKCFPQEMAYWKLDTFDPVTGAFTAHILR